MSVANRIAPTLAARQARASARAAEREARDGFIMAQLPLLGGAFEAMLRAALGIDTRISLGITPLTYTVQGLSFASLTVDTWVARCSLDAPTRGVTFTPALDFRERDQFGRIGCALDFPYAPGRGRADRIARVLLERGIQLRGTTTASLLLPLDSGARPLEVDDLEQVFDLWWLRP